MNTTEPESLSQAIARLGRTPAHEEAAICADFARGIRMGYRQGTERQARRLDAKARTLIEAQKAYDLAIARAHAVRAEVM